MIFVSVRTKVPKMKESIMKLLGLKTIIGLAAATAAVGAFALTVGAQDTASQPVIIESGQRVTDWVSLDQPMSMYDFTGSEECPMRVFLMAEDLDVAPKVELINMTSGTVISSVITDVGGSEFILPRTSHYYRLVSEHNMTNGDEMASSYSAGVRLDCSLDTVLVAGQPTTIVTETDGSTQTVLIDVTNPDGQTIIIGDNPIDPVLPGGSGTLLDASVLEDLVTIVVRDRLTDDILRVLNKPAGIIQSLNLGQGNYIIDVAANASTESLGVSFLLGDSVTDENALTINAALNLVGTDDEPLLVVDVDGNIIDTLTGEVVGLLGDTDGDGIIDVEVTAVDADGDGFLDVDLSVGDSDGDGVVQLEVTVAGDDEPVLVVGVDANAGGDDGLNVDVGADAGGDDGLNVDVGADAGDDDGLNVDVGADAGGDDGLNVDVGVGVGGDDGLNVEVGVDVGGSGGSSATPPPIIPTLPPILPPLPPLFP
jgi:hypothetical protein